MCSASSPEERSERFGVTCSPSSAEETNRANQGEPGTPDVVVVGLGYVGLTLAAALARAGHRIIGLERNPAVLEAINDRRAPFYEPGLDDLLKNLPDGAFTVRQRLDGVLAQTIIVCVGTGYDHSAGVPDLSDLDAAIETALDLAGTDTLIIVRSTVPVGTCRDTVLPKLAEVSPTPLMAYCPERTIQGQALAEIARLPQIIGGVDDASARRAARLFADISPAIVTVSSLEAAELIKLVCNAHTDLLYGFGNEVAFIAGALGLSSREVIDAASRDYPRPSIALPGYVGGSCLVKDPYLLMASSSAAGYRPSLVPAARIVNERLPGYVADQVAAWLDDQSIPVADAKVLLCGIAYKGRPETDDARGAASAIVARALAARVGTLAGHDPRLADAAIAGAGLQPIGLAAGLDGAHALVLLTDHEAYRQAPWSDLLGLMARPALVVDVWCLLPDGAARPPWVSYRGFGRG
jgi:UDP-N-acetyl-D-mannosaminuronic acid dehydrogenase